MEEAYPGLKKESVIRVNVVGYFYHGYARPCRVESQ